MRTHLDPPRPPRALLALVACAAASCSDGSAQTDVASLDLRGTRIDGSEDPASEPKTAAPVVPVLAVETVETGETREPGAGAVDPEAPGTAEAAELGAAGGDPALDDPAPPDPAPEVTAELGRLRDDGVRELSFADLSLEGIDYELLVDSLLFPDEYAEDGVDLPTNVAALSGQRVAIGGYMIPGKIERGGNVRDFMLVRDLLACCFGGIPKPDEWIDVVMADDAKAEYIRYRPLIVTGTLTVGEDMDADAFNPAVFKLVGTEVRRRE